MIYHIFSIFLNFLKIHFFRLSTIHDFFCFVTYGCCHSCYQGIYLFLTFLFRNQLRAPQTNPYNKNTTQPAATGQLPRPQRTMRSSFLQLRL